MLDDTKKGTKINAYELADRLERPNNWQQENNFTTRAATMLRQQQAEIEDLKNANRFIQNFAEEQHQRAVALEMRELTDEEIWELSDMVLNNSDVIGFARAILRKAQEQ